MLTENTQAIMLLTCHFSPPGKGEVNPLTITEYARFAEWLLANNLEPGALFNQFDDIFARWRDARKTITADRIRVLLGRGMAMGLALEKWQQVGIWFLTRSDSEYPVRLKKRLGVMSPPVIFGLGDNRLLNIGGLAVVGSRDIGDNDVFFTRDVGRKAAGEGVNIVSGGAKGVDETAMLSALEAEGTALGILADSLSKAATSGKWRKHLKSGSLALISTYYPDARFSVGNAMGRNKYIYCLADHALVVRSDKDKGGTWAGAKENLTKNWITLLVNPSPVEGNQALLQMGGIRFPWENGVGSIRDSLTCSTSKLVQDTSNSCLGKQSGEDDQPSSKTLTTGRIEDHVFFNLFYTQLQRVLADRAVISTNDLQKYLPDLNIAQITDWLERARKEKFIEYQEDKGICRLADQ